jgi:predicted protein tyrosine phosphatase
MLRDCSWCEFCTAVDSSRTMDPGGVQGSNAIKAVFGVRSPRRAQVVLHCLEGRSSSWVEALMIHVVTTSSQLPTMI